MNAVYPPDSPAPTVMKVGARVRRERRRGHFARGMWLFDVWRPARSLEVPDASDVVREVDKSADAQCGCLHELPETAGNDALRCR